jgi:succinate-acetate transporter protein
MGQCKWRSCGLRPKLTYLHCLSRRLGAMFCIGGIGLFVAGIMEWLLGNTFPFVTHGDLIHSLFLAEIASV